GQRLERRLWVGACPCCQRLAAIFSRETETLNRTSSELKRRSHAMALRYRTRTAAFCIVFHGRSHTPVTLIGFASLHSNPGLSAKVVLVLEKHIPCAAQMQVIGLLRVIDRSLARYASSVKEAALSKVLVLR